MKRLNTTCSRLLTASTLLLAIPTLANDYIILVAPKDSPAYAFAESKANDTNVFVERKHHRGLTKAAELLQSANQTV